MLVELPVQYRAKVRLRRKRNPCDRIYTARVPLDVPELTERDAPVVAWRSAGFGPEIAVRFFEGSFFEPVSGKDKPDVQAPEFRPDEAIGIRGSKSAVSGFRAIGRAGVVPLLNIGPLQAWQTEVFATELRDDLDVADVVSSSRDEAVADALRYWSTFVLADGVLCRRTGCPTVEYSDRYRQVEHSHTGRFLDHAHPFRIDRWEEAVKLALDAGMPRRHLTFKKPEILRPDILETFDFEAWYVRRAAKFVVDSLSAVGNRGWGSGYTSKLSIYPLDVVLAFARLRDGLGADADVGEVATALEDFALAAASHGTLCDERDGAANAAARLRSVSPVLEPAP